MQSRDQLAYEVYQSILQTQRGDWIDLIHCAPMASQYHMSVYSTLKFGSNGAPYAYLPLSLQQPGVTESVLAKQRWLEMHAWRLQLHSSGDPERPDSLSAMKITAEISDSPQERFAEDLQCAKEDASKAAVASSPAAMIIKTSDSHPIKCVRKTHTKFSQHVFQHLPRSWNVSSEGEQMSRHAFASLTELVPRERLAEKFACKLQHTDTYMMGQVRGEELTRLPKSLSLDRLLSQYTPTNEKAFSCEVQERILGNLLLSSCPGKKVRLDEPVQGRCGIRRDLKVDLERFKGMGVRAIVCCLDDEELHQLGSPIEEYKKEAQMQGFDLLWLPIAEGFAPVDVTKFDIFLSMLILNYTLRGLSILVHCRGGVGRAGMVACGWMFKMNLVTPDEPAPPVSVPGSEESHALSMVLKLVEVIRSRRSVRAIETAEQARFLMDYVRFVYRQEHARACVAACTAP